MILASRSAMPARLALRRNPASYGPPSAGLPKSASATATHFQFHHLMESTPPCSPGLPSIIPRHGKKLPPRRYRPLVRLLFWLFGISIALYYLGHQLDLNALSPVSTHFPGQKNKLQLKLEDEAILPSSPSPIQLVDQNGRRKWTVFIPPTSVFPLRPSDYSSICQISTQWSESSNQYHTDYYRRDSSFVDVLEASQYGSLFRTSDFSEFDPRSSLNDLNTKPLIVAGDGNTETQVCSRSLTFVMETSDAGLGVSLMQLWLAYGLAQKEGRAFFLDDSNWPYGSYESYFEPPPKPLCQPPPRHHVVPCPHQARHLIVSAATSKWTFGSEFETAVQSLVTGHMHRHKPLFDLIHVGYAALFKLKADDQSYVDTRAAELQAHKLESQGSSKAQIVGLHVRRGDRHPLEYQYSGSYIPLDRYATAARNIMAGADADAAQQSPLLEASKRASVAVIASDDPDIAGDEEFNFAEKAQSKIILASKKTLDAASPPSANNWIDRTVGWEGGFYRDIFFSLGGATNAPGPDTRSSSSLPELAMQLRFLVGRAYLLDLALLGQHTDKVVCASSATGCRLIAVMMGWEKAIEQHGWINVEGDGEWTSPLLTP